MHDIYLFCLGFRVDNFPDDGHLCFIASIFSMKQLNLVHCSNSVYCEYFFDETTKPYAMLKFNSSM